MLIDEFYRRDIAHVGDFVRTPTGDLATIAGVENVRRALLRRLLTTKGSLVHRPDYGVGIKSFQNGIADSAQKIRLAVILKEQFERDERVEEVLGLTVGVDVEQPEVIRIKTKVKLIGLGEQFFAFGIGDTIDGI